MKIQLPKSIQNFIGQSKLHRNKVGQSPADVYSFEKNHDTFYLKISDNIYANTTYSVLREAKILDWLQGKLQLPELILMASDLENEYMISKAINAKPIAQIHGKSHTFFLEIYQEALKQLQHLSIENCPFRSDRTSRLAESRFLLDHELLDDVYLADMDPDDIDPNIWENFQGKEQLWQYLNQQHIQEELVFSHGDMTDTNIFLDHKDQIHFLDLGRAGIADKFVDITFVERSLREDYSKQISQQFIQSLTQDHPFKRDYFLKLDELN